MISWIYGELESRGWSQRELARRADISTGALSMVMNQQRGAGPEFCKSVARAFGAPPVVVFRLAGLLPPATTEKEELDEIMYWFSRLSDHDQKRFIQIAKAWAQADQEEGGLGEVGLATAPS